MVDGPLDGVRVVELTHAWAGPYCGMILGDMGAEVIKVESPRQEPEARGGYPYVNGESVIFMMLHRNKKSVTIDLKQPEGKEIFFELIRTTDILVQNFRPGVMKKLGLAYDDLKSVNPGLVYVTISGYGETGPKAGLPGVNMIALAESGLAATSMVDGRPPVPVGTALCDIVAAMWASNGALAAYVRRLRTGQGQELETSLVEAGVSLMYSPVAMHDHAKTRGREQSRKNDGNAPSGFFKTSDGSYLTVFASYPALWERFVRAMDLEYLAEEERFRTRDQRTANAAELHAILAEIFATRPTPEWVKLLVDAGVPASPVNTVGQMVDDEHLRARDMVHMQRHPTAGDLRLLGLPVKLSGTPGGIRTPAPALGEHTRAVLETLGFEKKYESLKERGII